MRLTCTVPEKMAPLGSLRFASLNGFRGSACLWLASSGGLEHEMVNDT